MAIHLVRSGVQDLDLEIEPAIVVGGRNRMPDFRVRRGDGDWIYVEDTQANISRAQAEVRNNMERIAGLVDALTGTFAAEVFLKREPTPDEVDVISAEIKGGHSRAEIKGGHSRADTRETELEGDLGTLYWNAEAPEP